MTTSEIYNLLFNGGKFSKHYLIKLTHPDLGTIRLVNNNEDVEFAAETYKASNFTYTQPNNKGDSGTLNITSIDNEDLFQFIDAADDRYSLQVVGVINQNGYVQRLKTFRHFYGSVSMGEDWNINFNLGKDDRLDMKFLSYSYDTNLNPGNA